MILDFWYNDKITDVTKITFAFYDCDCVYRGNMFINDKCIGDFSTSDSLEIERTFSQFAFNY